MAANGSAEVQASSKMVSKRRYRSALERRQIVEETLQPGASVAIIARAHEVNANQVFCWRKRYRQGQLDAKQDSAELNPTARSWSLGRFTDYFGASPVASALDLRTGATPERITHTLTSRSVSLPANKTFLYGP